MAKRILKSVNNHNRCQNKMAYIVEFIVNFKVAVHLIDFCFLFIHRTNSVSIWLPNELSSPNRLWILLEVSPVLQKIEHIFLHDLCNPVFFSSNRIIVCLQNISSIFCKIHCIRSRKSHEKQFKHRKRTQCKLKRSTPGTYGISMFIFIVYAIN